MLNLGVLFFNILFLFFGCIMKYMGYQWMETVPPAMKPGVLAIGPAGKNQPGDS